MSLQYLFLVPAAVLVVIFVAGALIGLSKMFVVTACFLGRKLVAPAARAGAEEPAIALENGEERPAQAAIA